MLQPAGRHPQTRIYSCPDGVQKRYSNVVGMAVCPRDDFLLPPGQITRPLCAPRQASPSGNVLPVSVIPLRPPFARRREKPPDRIRPLPRISDYRRCRCNTRNIYRWPLRIGCGHRHSAGLAKPFVLCHRALLLSFGCLLNIQNLRMALSVSDQ